MSARTTGRTTPRPSLGPIAKSLDEFKQAGDAELARKRWIGYSKAILDLARDRLSKNKGTDRDLDEELDVRRLFRSLYQAAKKGQLSDAYDPDNVLRMMLEMAVFRTPKLVIRSRTKGKHASTYEFDPLAGRPPRPPEAQLLIYEADRLLHALDAQLRETAINWAGGVNKQEIAERLSISPQTVEKQFRRIKGICAGDSPRNPGARAPHLLKGRVSNALEELRRAQATGSKAIESSAMQTLWDSYSRRVLGLADKHQRETKKKARDKEDLCQDVFLKFVGAIRKSNGSLSKVHDRNHLWNFLCKVTQHRAKEIKRDNTRLKRDERRTVSEYRLVGKDSGGRNLGLNQFSDQQTAVRLVDAVKHRARLKTLLKKLAAELETEEREVLNLWAEGLKPSSIANSLGRTIATVEQSMEIIRRNAEDIAEQVTEEHDQH